ncbi:MFS transporter [Thiohalorhabdus sp.]|uniref:MFS transporter n=1 Tax=Thiohalorhabdus sp. TaxID=3094134 RepID=UPI002FC313C4
MLAGESIFMLPYMRKTFQTSMESVFQVSSTELGLLNSLFGVAALICYLPSGWLADRFSARKLLTLALVSTGAGGLVLLTQPDFTGLLALHAFWGVTSILMFWAALIKATREWGRPETQGLSFGLLDAGRGVAAAVLASLATAGFALAGSTHGGLNNVIWVYSMAPLVAAVVIWRVVPDALYAGERRDEALAGERASVRQALAKPTVWLQAVAIFCAYMLFLGTYEFPAFAEKAYGHSKTFGAVLGTARDWMRPVAALGAGLLADRLLPSRAIGGAFALLATVFASLLLVPPTTGGLGLFWVQVIGAGLAVFALRGIYFAVMEEAGIPHYLTGTTVGFVSLVGFFPDTFAHLLAGWFADSFPGVLGYRYYFGVLAAVAGLGLAAAVGLRLLSRRTAPSS